MRKIVLMMSVSLDGFFETAPWGAAFRMRAG